MEKAEAGYHMKRCVDSGLWVADAGKVNEDLESVKSSEADQYATIKVEKSDLKNEEK